MAKKATPKQPDRGADKTKRLTIDIPADLHMAVKLECVRRQITIRDMVIKLMAEEVGTPD